MITEYTSPLIPAAVAAGKFPKADEDKLTGLAAHWQKIGTEISGDGDAVTSLSRTVFANWSGSGADAASAQISQVSRFATSLAAATGVISKGCTTGASYVTNTKNGINVVLIQLDNLTKAQILIGLADPLQVPICLIRIIELRKRARALISAYYDALTSAMGSIPFAVTIQPRPKRATTASTATSGTAQGSVGQGGTGQGGTGGGGGTSSAASTSTASATGVRRPGRTATSRRPPTATPGPEISPATRTSATLRRPSVRCRRGLTPPPTRAAAPRRTRPVRTGRSTPTARQERLPRARTPRSRPHRRVQTR